MRNRVVPLSALSVLLFAACATSMTPRATSPGAGAVDPGAGAWRTWVPGSTKDLRLPPPPDAQATAAELQQVRALAGQRDAAALVRIRRWDFSVAGASVERRHDRHLRREPHSGRRRYSRVRDDERRRPGRAGERLGVEVRPQPPAPGRDGRGLKTAWPHRAARRIRASTRSPPAPPPPSSRISTRRRRSGSRGGGGGGALPHHGRRGVSERYQGRPRARAGRSLRASSSR